MEAISLEMYLRQNLNTQPRSLDLSIFFDSYNVRRLQSAERGARAKLEK